MILLTGCAGFIGARVAEMLLEKGEMVIGVDDLNNYYDVQLKKWRLGNLKRFSGFKFFKADISDLNQMRKIFKKTGIKSVINLAARAGVRASIENPWIYFEVNVTGNLNLLELSRQSGIKKYVLASTSSVYAGAGMPFRETANPGNPLSPYAASKRAAEITCYTCHHLYGLDITVLRYFTVYGPAGRPDMSPFRFIRLIDEGKPIQVYGDGNQKRDFTYVDDIALGTIKALKPAGYEIINLGNSKPFRLNEFIRMIEAMLGKRAKIKRYPFHSADIKATWADIGKAKNILDWQPQIDLKTGLKRTVDWYKENRHWLKTIKM